MCCLTGGEEVSEDEGESDEAGEDEEESEEDEADLTEAERRARALDKFK